MRAFLAFGVCVLAAYWIDQTYAGGTLTQIVIGMYRAALR